MIAGVVISTNTVAQNLWAQTKLTHEAAKYQDHPNNGQQCSGCVQFVAPASCKVVEDPVAASGHASFSLHAGQELGHAAHRTGRELVLRLERVVLAVAAEDGVEAWEMIQKEMPDLVVSDVMMPNMDGFELCRLMKSTYETSHIPLIMLTALSGKAEQLHGLGLGADDYLTKPFDMTLLVQRIKSIIRNRAAVKEKALKLIKVPTSNNDQILTNELNDKFLKKMSEVVRANISNSEFGKDDFAAAMNVSSSLLYKKVKALTDQSPTDFIKVVRLDYAQELLQSRKYSVTEVSELCGFSSIGYFSTVFKKHFGKSPTEI